MHPKDQLRSPLMQGQHFFETGLMEHALPVESVASNFSYKDVRTSTTAEGNLVLHGVRIFKSGTFRDSLGRQNTWERHHLEMMIAHFHLLKDSDVFPNPVVRVDHWGGVKNLGGYFQDVYLDEDPTFLLGDLELIKQDVIADWKRGLYRSRSLEVGEYTTNDEATYFPVIFGVAFVDIPAVEGLHSAPSKGLFSHVVSDNKEEDDLMPFNGFPSVEAWAAAAEYARATETAAITYAAAVQDFYVACDYARQQGFPESALDEEAVIGSPPANTAASFSIGGTVTSDPGAVQAYISGLERDLTIHRETANQLKLAARGSFVSNLAKDGKIGAAQVDSLKAVAAGLDDAGFEAFTKSYEAAPKLSLFQSFGTENDTGTPNTGGEASAQYEIHKEIVAQLKRAGQSDDEIKETASFKAVAAFEAAASGRTA